VVAPSEWEQSPPKHGLRKSDEARASLEEATAVLGLLAMLEGRRAREAARALAELLDGRTLLPVAEVLMRWANTQPGPK
jgi:hypothetical protein